MLNVGMFMMGNAGGQVASLAIERKVMETAIVVNSSENDLKEVNEAAIKFMTGDGKGVGQDRSRSKEYTKNSMASIISDQKVQDYIKSCDVVFVGGSAGGGTCSGSCIMVYDLLRNVFKTGTTFILLGILPTLETSGRNNQTNALEFLHELFNVCQNPKWMLYDNNRCSKGPYYEMIKTVNERIVDDIQTLSCFWNYSTPYDSIDERDMLNMLNTSTGRIFIASLPNIKEKDLDETTIEKMLIEEIKTNPHCEIQHDKKVVRSGLICDLAEPIVKEFNTSIPGTTEFTGAATEAFVHMHVNDDRKEDNRVYLIMTGLSPVVDRMHKIEDRIEEIDHANEIQAADDSTDIDISKYTEKKDICTEDADAGNANVDMNNIFGKYM